MTPARKRRLYLVVAILAGVSIAGALGLAAFSGGALALDYVPSESHAWLSVLGMNQAFAGGFVRGLHRAAAEAAVVLALIIAVYRHYRTIRLDQIDSLKG